MELIVTAIIVAAGIGIVWTLGRFIRPRRMFRPKIGISDSQYVASNAGNKRAANGDIELGDVYGVDVGRNGDAAESGTSHVAAEPAEGEEEVSVQVIEEPEQDIPPSEESDAAAEELAADSGLSDEETIQPVQTETREIAEPETDVRVEPASDADAGRPDIPSVEAEEPSAPVEQSKSPGVLFDDVTAEDDADEAQDAGQLEHSALAIGKTDYFDGDDSDDRLIDLVATFAGNGTTVQRNQVLAAFRQCPDKLAKPHKLVGRAIDGGGLRALDADSGAAFYSDLYLVMQLADQYGPAGASHWSAFVNVAGYLSNELGREFALSMPRETAFQEASELYRLLSQLDIEAIIVLRSKVAAGITASGMDVIAGEMNFRRDGDGGYAPAADRDGSVPPFRMMLGSEANRVLALDSDQLEQSNSLVFFSRLPSVSDPAEAFSRMFQTAEKMADRLYAELVDENFQPLTRQQVPAILTHIRQMRNVLIENGVTPGGDVAIRLFRKDDGGRGAKALFHPESRG